MALWYCNPKKDPSSLIYEDSFGVKKLREDCALSG